MASETISIKALKDQGTLFFPVVHSKGILGPLASEAFDISESSCDNNWNNVTETGFYVDSNGSNRPPDNTGNTYSTQLPVMVQNYKDIIIQQTVYPKAGSETINIGSASIQRNYYRVGTVNGGNVTWSTWKELGDATAISGLAARVLSLETRCTTLETDLQALQDELTAFKTTVAQTYQTKIGYGTADPEGGSSGDVYIKINT